MKKKLKLIYIILAIIVLLIILFFIINQYFNITYSIYNSTIEENIILNTINNIKINIKDGTLTNTSATIIIENNSNRNYGYGKWFRIDKKENEKWKEVIPIDKNYVFTSIGFNLFQNQKLEDTIDWSKLYGKLEKGHYRLIKNIYDTSSNYVFVEFTIY